MSTFEQYTLPPLLEQIRQSLSTYGKVYLVGGALRNLLLGKTSHDYDFVVPQNALNIARHIADVLKGAYFPIDPERQVGRVILTREDGERFFLDFSVFQGNTLENDLRMRDFTINALALDLHNPAALIDPLNGVMDLKEKRLRPCSPEAMQTDPVRILRGVRLAVQLKFQLLPETIRKMRQAAQFLPRVSAERIRDEMFRILEGARPDDAIRTLDVLGALAYILPEVVALKKLEQSSPHVNDAWNHTLSTMSKLEQILNVLQLEYDEEKSANLMMGLVSLYLGRYRKQLEQHLKEHINRDRSLKPLLFLAALCHDIGKPITKQIEVTGRIRFIHHEKEGEALIKVRARNLHLSNPEIKRLRMIIRHHLRPIMFAQSNKPLAARTIYRYYRDLGIAGVDVALLALADVLATYEYTIPQEKWLDHINITRALLEAWYERREEQVAPPPIISGNDLMDEFHLHPGPQIGYLLEKVREAQVSGRVRTREDALEWARALLKNPPKSTRSS